MERRGKERQGLEWEWKPTFTHEKNRLGEKNSWNEVQWVNCGKFFHCMYK